MEVTTQCPNCGTTFGTRDAKLEFDRLYINAKELSELTGISYNESLKIIEKCRSIMSNRSYYVPETKPKLALFRIVSEFLGFSDTENYYK